MHTIFFDAGAISSLEVTENLCLWDRYTNTFKIYYCGASNFGEFVSVEYDSLLVTPSLRANNLLSYYLDEMVYFIREFSQETRDKCKVANFEELEKYDFVYSINVDEASYISVLLSPQFG